MDKDERRRHSRYLIEGSDINCKMLFATEVKLINMSLGGASITLDKRLVMGGRYTLKLENKDQQVALRCAVVWENLAGLKKNSEADVVPVYEVGLEFDNVLTESGAEIVDFIKSSMDEHSSVIRLTGPRVKIHDAEKTVLVDYNKSFSVKKISLGGILLETDQRFKVDARFPMELTFEDGQKVQLNGRIASCVENTAKSPSVFETGVEFVDMNEQESAKIAQFIKMLESI